MSSNVERYRHLILTDWDRDFLSNPNFTAWFNAQMAESPIPADTPLVDYVRDRIQLAKSGNAVAAQTTTAQPEAAPRSAPTPANDEVVDEYFLMDDYAPEDEAASAPSTIGSSHPLDVSLSTETPPPPYAPFASSSSSIHDASTAASSLQMQQQMVQQEQLRAQMAVAPQQLGFSPAAFGGAPVASTSSLTAAAAAAAPTQSIASSSKSKNKTDETAPAKKKKKIVSVSTKEAPSTSNSNGSVKGKEKANSNSVKTVPLNIIATKAAIAAVGTAASSSSVKGSSSAPKPPSRSATPQPPPIASTSTSSSSSTSAQEDSWSLILPTLRETLTPTRLSRASASTAQKLSKILLQFQLPAAGPTLGPWGDGSEVPPSGRTEVIQTLLKPGGGAGSEFWTAMAGKGAEGGLEVWQSWLLGASAGFAPSATKKSEEKKVTPTHDEKVTSKRVKELESGLVGILKIISKLPLTVEHLKRFIKFGARIKRLSLRGEGEAKTLALKLMEKWTALQQEANSRVVAAGGSATTSATATGAKKETPKASSLGSKMKEDEVAKKRKAADSAEDAKKKLKATPTPSTQPTAASLFGSKALPSFKKKPDAAPPAPANFASALAAMQKKQAAGPKKVEDEKAAGGTASRGKKVKKSVKWRDEAEKGDLVAVRFIERREQTFNEGADGMADQEQAKLMDGEEGKVHAYHFADELDEMEEEIDWYEPVVVFIPADAQHEQATSPAADLETTRQSLSMAVDDDERPSPGEPVEAYTPLTSEPSYIPLSLDLRDDPSVQATIAHAQASTIPLGGFAANEQIQTLLGQLTGGGAFGVPVPPQHQQQLQQQPVQQQGFDQATLDALQNYDPQLIRGIVEQTPGLASLAGQLDHLGVYGSQPQNHQGMQHHPQPGYPPQQRPHNSYYNPQAPIPSAWGNQGQPYQPPPPSITPNPSGKRAGVQKGRKRGIPMVCKFFNLPRGCDRGDDCMFIHERNGKDVRG